MAEDMYSGLGAGTGKSEGFASLRMAISRARDRAVSHDQKVLFSLEPRIRVKSIGRWKQGLEVLHAL